MISVVILTKNEALDLPNCLQSLETRFDDIHVLDSGSTDATIDIANQFGAKVIYNSFISFGIQRNYAIDNIKFKYDWILFLDADEQVTTAFYNEMIKCVKASDDSIAGYYCCWKMLLDGIWLKRCDNFPKWQFRLLRYGKARFTDYGHGQKEGEVNGKILYIKEPYLHYGFSKGWALWLDRHNRYSTLEAKERAINIPPFAEVFSKHGSIRNKALKAWLIKIPGWPFLRFLHAYIIKFGFLEGIPGFIYCVNMAYYEFLIKIKIRELTIENEK